MKATRTVRGASLIVLLLTLAPGEALAQSGPLAGTVEFAAGVRWIGEMSVGGSNATETAPGGGRYGLFATSTTLAPATGIDGSVAVRLTRLVEASLTSSIAKAELRTRISDDVEGIPGVVAREEVTQLAVEGALVMRLPRWRPSERTVPFVSAGGGYLRQLHQGRTLVESGTIYHVGGGLDYVWKPNGERRVKASGLRLDARAIVRKGGVAFDDGADVSPALGVSLFARF